MAATLGEFYQHFDMVIIPFYLYIVFIKLPVVKSVIFKAFAEQSLVKQTSLFLYLDVIIGIGKRSKHIRS